MYPSRGVKIFVHGQFHHFPCSIFGPKQNLAFAVLFSSRKLLLQNNTTTLHGRAALMSSCTAQRETAKAVGSFTVSFCKAAAPADVFFSHVLLLGNTQQRCTAIYFGVLVCGPYRDTTAVAWEVSLSPYAPALGTKASSPAVLFSLLVLPLQNNTTTLHG